MSTLQQQWLIPHWPDLPAGVGVLSTTRRGGVSLPPYHDGQHCGGLNLGVHVGDDPAHVAANRAILRAILPAEPAWLSQVHGSAVVDVSSLPAGEVPQADACIATAGGAVCAILTADCLPVLFSDAAGKVVGAAHAGWRGLAGGVLERTLEAMRAAGAGDIAAWLGPAIGQYQFEVGPDVMQAFLKQAPDESAVRHVTGAFSAIPDRPNKFRADIYALARGILHRNGVARVSGGEFCTVSNSARFYSYRRDGVTGRQATLIWIK